jgi:GT2 family glycosyltransferase
LKKTAVVILNWNGRKLLEEFLPGVIRDSRGHADIYVADNASTDDSINWIASNCPEAIIIRNSSNKGYAGGYNEALKNIRAEFFILLNSDVEVTPGWINPVISFMELHPEVAVAQPAILWHSKKDFYEYAGAAGGFIDVLGYPFCRGRIFQSLEKINLSYESPCYIFWATGACMFVRADVFHHSGGFDDYFFAHMEEIDLCWRIRNMGYEIVCIPESKVYHVGGATLSKSNPRKTLYNFRNNLSMLYKNLPAAYVLPVIFIRLILDGLAGLKFLLEGHGKDFIAVYKAHMQFYKRIINGTIKRTKITKSHSHVIYNGSIVWDYFILKKTRFSELGQKFQEKIKIR